MVPVAGVKLNHFGVVEPTPENVIGVDVRFEIVNDCVASVAPGVPRNSSPLGDTAGGAAVPAGTMLNTIAIDDRRMNAVGRREDDRAVIILRGESRWIDRDGQSRRRRTRHTVPAGWSDDQPVSTFIGVRRDGPWNGRGGAEHGHLFASTSRSFLARRGRSGRFAR